MRSPPHHLAFKTPSERSGGSAPATYATQAKIISFAPFLRRGPFYQASSEVPAEIREQVLRAFPDTSGVAMAYAFKKRAHRVHSFFAPYRRVDDPRK
ncbi:MAG: hypothetical protein ACJAZ1_000994 [Yoonia sp.]|jgi:hypothetical protein